MVLKSSATPAQAGLNKGEAAHKLKRAVFFHERGEIRDRSFESQAFRVSGLNLVVRAIASATRKPSVVEGATQQQVVQGT